MLFPPYCIRFLEKKKTSKQKTITNNYHHCHNKIQQYSRVPRLPNLSVTTHLNIVCMCVNVTACLKAPYIAICVPWHCHRMFFVRRVMWIHTCRKEMMGIQSPLPSTQTACFTSLAVWPPGTTMASLLL